MEKKFVISFYSKATMIMRHTMCDSVPKTLILKQIFMKSLKKFPFVIKCL